jgi:hypothetical protein
MLSCLVDDWHFALIFPSLPSTYTILPSDLLHFIPTHITLDSSHPLQNLENLTYYRVGIKDGAMAFGRNKRAAKRLASELEPATTIPVSDVSGTASSLTYTETGHATGCTDV